MKVNYYVFRENDSDETITVIMEDGGVASAFNPDFYYRTDLYQNRINKDTKLESIWDELSEGKMYCQSWDGESFPLKTEADDKLILSMLEWLCMSTEKTEFVAHEMGEMNDESFNKVFQLLKF